jgi:hypothetical protein
VAIGIGSSLKRSGLPALQKSLLAAAQTLSNQLCGEVSAAPGVRSRPMKSV